MSFELLRFIRPELALLLALVLPLAGLAAVAFRSRARALARFGGSGAALVSSSAGRHIVKSSLLVFAAGVVAIALAGPYLEVRQREVRWSGIDLVVAVDVSQSMAARDVAPDRLRAARAVVADLAERLAGSRIGLVLFAGNGVIRYPATTDPRVLPIALDNSAHAFRPTPGSSLRAAVDASLSAYAPEARDAATPKALVLVTDGEDEATDVPDLAALRSRNVRVFSLGVGTTAGAEIPTYDQDGSVTGVLRRGGTPVISRLDEPRLLAIADAGGGRYWRYDGTRTMDEVVGELRGMGTTELSTEAGSAPDDLYQPFLALAIAALVLERLLGDHRPMPLSRAGERPVRRRRPVGALATERTR